MEDFIRHLWEVGNEITSSVSSYLVFIIRVWLSPHHNYISLHGRRRRAIEDTILAVDQASTITFADIAGHAAAKAVLHEAIVLPLKFPHLFRRQCCIYVVLFQAHLGLRFCCTKQ